MKNMKIWKRIIPIVLIVAMVLASISSAFAASPEFSKTTEEWERLRDNVLEYDEIADLIHEYNTTVAGNEIAYKKTRNKDLDEITQQYRHAAGTYGGQATDAESEIEAITYELQEREADIKADDNVDDGENDRLTYKKAEAGLVKQAQQLMNTYNRLLLQRDLENNNKAYIEQQLNSMNVRQGQGLATTAEVLTARQAVQTSAANLITLEARIEDAGQSLAIMTGWKQDNRPEIRSIPGADLEWMAALNPTADKETALANDYSLQIEKRRLAHSESQENIDLYTTNVRKTEESIKAAVDLGYQSVLQAYTAYEQAQVALTLAETNLNTGQRKYQLGTLGGLEFSALQFQHQTAVTTCQLKEMELFQALQDYDWLLHGLASS